MSTSALIAKAGTALLTNENLRKKTVALILAGVIAFLIPLMTVASVFCSLGQVTAEDIKNQFSDETKAELQYMEQTENAIAQAFYDNGLSYSEVAQAAYCMYLYDVQKNDSDFINKLVACYSSGGTDDEIVAALSNAFQVTIPSDEYESVAERIRSTCIDTSGFISATKNSTDLVSYVMQAAGNGWGYVYGTYGTVLTDAVLEQKKQQFPDNINPYYDFIRDNYMGRRTADCVGLIKGYAWFDPETASYTIGSNGMPDVSADGLYAAAAVKGAMDTMPDVPGIAVWQSGHIGVYIGNGKVVEAKGTMYGVVTSELSKGTWQGWCYLPAIQYNG